MFAHMLRIIGPMVSVVIQSHFNFNGLNIVGSMEICSTVLSTSFRKSSGERMCTILVNRLED